MLVNKEYKDSGVSWLGNIPALWNIVKTKRHFQNEKRVAGKYANQYERLALTMNGVIKRDKEDAEGLQPESFEGYQVLEQNQLVFKLIDLENVKTSRVGLSPYTGIVSPAYIILHNDQQDNRFYYYYYMNMYYQEIFNYLGGEGVRSALNAKDLLETPIPDISLKQQKVIADYLDRECARIDNIVEIQRNLIEKLKEYKKSVITEAVTRGLNPNAPMKDSGIEWIGKIPEHWEVRKFKYQNERSNTGEGIDKVFWTDDVKDDYFYTAGLEPIHSSYLDFPDWKYTNDKDLLLARNGTPYVYIPYNHAMYSDHIIRTTIKQNTDKRFVRYALQQSITSVVVDTVSITTWSISIWNEQKLPFPSLSEQQAIADYLDQKCAKIDSVIEKREKMVDLLTEYKKSLIYECVTGKKEVA